MIRLATFGNAGYIKKADEMGTGYPVGSTPTLGAYFVGFFNASCDHPFSTRLHTHRHILSQP